MAARLRGHLAAALNAVILAPALFASPAWGTAHVWIVFALVSAFAWVEAANATPHDISTGKASRGPMLTGLSLLVVFVVALLSAADHVPPALVGLGATSMLGGVALRRAAMRALGPAFVSELRPLSPGDRVRHGPYGWCEHPSELGLLAIAAGAAIALGSWPAAITWAATLAPIVLLRMRAESRALAASH